MKLSNRTVAFSTLTILLLVSTFAASPSPPGHASLTGTVCLASDGATSCPSAPASLSGAVGSQLRVSVFIQGSDSLNGFDVTVLADHTTLRPVGTDLSGTVLVSPTTTVLDCIGGVLVQGSSCSPTDTPDTIHLAVVGAAGQLTTAPTTGLLFTAIYNVTGTGPIPVSYQTGCSPSSISGTTTCIDIANGSLASVPETAQTATFTGSNPAPDFSISASPTSISASSGASATSTITVSPLGGFNGTVTLATTISPGTGLTCTLSSTTISGGSGSSTLSCAPSVSGTWTVTVTGTSGSLSHQASVTITSGGVPFQLAASPTSVATGPNMAGTSTITVAFQNGFTGTVTLSSTVSPLGLTCTLSQTSFTTSGTSTLSCSSPNTGTFTVIVTGTSGSTSSSVTVAYTISGSSAGVVCLVNTSSSSCPSAPTTFSAPVGSQLRVAVFIQNSNGLNGFDITLLADHSILQPAAVDLTGTVLVSPTQTLLLCVGGVLVQGNACSSTDTIDTIHLAAVGASGQLTSSPTTGLLFTAVYNVTGSGSTTIGYQTGCSSSSVSGTSTCITIANGTPTPVPETAQTATFDNIGLDFAITASPMSLTIQRGNFGASTITLTSFNGFTGTITLTDAASPAGLTVSLSPSSVNLPAGGTATSTMSITGATPGNYTVAVTATIGSVSHVTTVSVTITGSNPADFTVSANPTSLQLAPNTTGSSTITVTAVNGFNGTVTLTVSVSSSNLQATVSPTFINASGTSTLALTSAVSGTYTATVTGTSGSLSHSASVAVNVVQTIIGTICLVPSGASSCPSSPPSLSAPVGTQLRVSVFIQGSDAINGFDITLLANHNILKPSGVDTTGTLFPPGFTILQECIGGTLIIGSACSSTDTADTIHLAIVGFNGGISPSPLTGLLFTAIYNVTSIGSTSVGFQTGCSPSSVNGTTTCALTVNGTPPPVPETVQTANFSTSVPAPDFSISANSASFVLHRGTSTSATITVTSLNGFNGTVTLQAVVTPATTHPLTASLNSASLTLTSGGTASTGIVIAAAHSCTPSTYTITITATSGSITHTITITVIVTK